MEEVSTVLINVKVKINRVTIAVIRFVSNTVGCVRPEKLLAMIVKRRAILLRCVTLRSDVLTWLSSDQECNLIDVNGDSEPEYGVRAIDVVQINNVELLKTAGGQPRSLNIQLRSGNSFFYATVDTGSPVFFLN